MTETLSDKTILRVIREKSNRPMKISELVKCLAIPEVKRSEFRNCIKQLADEGKLIKIRGNRYGLPDEMNLVSGTIHGHPDGYGFLICDKPGPDVFIRHQDMDGAMHHDLVMVRIEAHKKNKFDERLAGKVIRILERKTTTLVGLYETSGKEGWVTPAERKYFYNIFIPHNARKGAQNGDMVNIEIVSYPSKQHNPSGKITEVLGPADDPEVEIQSIFRKHEVRLEFPDKVVKEAKQASVEISTEERAQRKNLTDGMIFTIDGERAMDFDDAVSIDRMAEGYRLGVHIADVSHYVREGSSLDEEAYWRGTSIYFPNGVIPMLPFELSNEICSLKPREERLTLSALIDFDGKGEMLGFSIFDSFIKSQYRFTYTQVARMLEKDTADAQHKPAFSSLKTMHELAQILRKRRFRLGSVDFNVPEPEIILDDKGNVEKIVKAEHNIAHELIEEFMLAANQVVAQHLASKDIPLIHRIHESPDEAKLSAFNDFVKVFGYQLKESNNPSSLDLQNLLKKAKGRPEERVVNTLLLRSMKKAKYSQQDPGHFCLAFEHYTHFTSPIRRYPDLIIHRLVKSFHKRKCSAKERKELYPRVTDFADQSSFKEEKAMLVEREMNDLLRAKYMADKVGKTYSGLITSVTAFGFFVELTEVYVEGLVHVSSLADDYYIYFEEEHKLQGQHKHRKYKIGDPVKVRVMEVDIAKRRISLTLAK